MCSKPFVRRTDMYWCGGRICIRVGGRCVFNPNPNFVRGTDVYSTLTLISCGGRMCIRVGDG